MTGLRLNRMRMLACWNCFASLPPINVTCSIIAVSSPFILDPLCFPVSGSTVLSYTCPGQMGQPTWGNPSTSSSCASAYVPTGRNLQPGGEKCSIVAHWVPPLPSQRFCKQPPVRGAHPLEATAVENGLVAITWGNSLPNAPLGLVPESRLTLSESTPKYTSLRIVDKNVSQGLPASCYLSYLTRRKPHCTKIP